MLRLWHIHWSLPDVYEEAYPFSVAWKFWTWGVPGVDFNPHFFNYPALTFYLNFAVQGLHYLGGSLAGLYPNPASFSQAFATDPTSFVILGRLVSVLFDAGTVYVAYRLGDAVGGKLVAALAGILVAINPLLVRQAQLINVDTPLTFFAVLGLYLMYRLVVSPKPKRYVHFGIVAGLAVASKYTGAVMLLGFALLAAVLWFRKEESRPTLREALSVFLWAGLVFVAMNPFTVLDLNTFLADLGFERYHARYGHLGIAADESTAGFYLLTVIPGALGWPLAVMLAVSVVLAIVKKEWKTYLLIVSTAVYVAGIGLWEMRADRYLLPALPVFLVLAAWGIVTLVEMINARLGARIPRAAALAALTAVAALIPAMKVWSYHQSFEKKDTRAIARELIRKNLPKGSAIVLAPMGLNPGDGYNVLGLPFNPVETERLSPFYDVRWYRGFDLAVTSDYDRARYEREPQRFAAMLNFYRELGDGRPPLADIAPEENQNGPHIRITDLRAPGHPESYPAELFTNLRSVGHDETVLAFLLNLGEVLYAKDRLRDCRQVLAGGLAIAPEDSRFLSTMAWACFKMGDYPAASDAVDDLLKAGPGRAEIVSLKGSILLKLDRVPEAEGYLLSALRMNDRLLSAYIDLSEVYTRRGDAEKAIDALETVLTLVESGGPEASYIQEKMDSLKAGEL